MKVGHHVVTFNTLNNATNITVRKLMTVAVPNFETRVRRRWQRLFNLTTRKITNSTNACLFVTNANPLHYYALRVPRKMALSVVYFRFTHRLGRSHYVWDEYLYNVL